MAALDITRTSYGFNGPAGRIGSTFTRIVSAIAEWNDMRMTRNALSSLSDRELEDIGLCRGDIEEIAAQHKAV